MKIRVAGGRMMRHHRPHWWKTHFQSRTYLGAQYRRLLARIGPHKAAMAVAHSILVIAYHLLRDHVPYRDLGHTYFDQRNPELAARRLAKRIEGLGFSVSIQPAA